MFAAQRGGHYDLFAENIDGTGLVRLTNSRDEEVEPAWSPDGTKIAFAKEESGGTQADLYVMNADGTDLRQLTNTDFHEDKPSWSPNGKKIAFVAEGSRFSAHIAVIDTDGSGRRLLTHGPGFDWGPVWSPDGRRIAFDRGPFPGDIYVMNADGSGVVRLTKSHHAFGAAWSPDGTRIAFLSGGDIDLIDAISGKTSILVSHVGDALSPFLGCPVMSWSPDGTMIAVGACSTVTLSGDFNGGLFCSSGVYVMNADGSGLRELPVAGGTEGGCDPAWQPPPVTG